MIAHDWSIGIGQQEQDSILVTGEILHSATPMNAGTVSMQDAVPVINKAKKCSSENDTMLPGQAMNFAHSINSDCTPNLLFLY